ncbi:AbiH family protein [Tenacibaculum finnmarkense]|nr:AbiH family protein [Tenacibaculum finnmarkense]
MIRSNSPLKIIIIGNGFDLSHGYPTDYGSFINKLFEENIQNNSKHNTLFRFEEKDTSGFSSYQIKLKKFNKYIYPKNNFFGKIVEEFENKNWSDIEELYYKELKSSNEKQALTLNKEFEVIKNKLEDYLSQNVKYQKPLSSYKSFFHQMNNSNTIILNFNYTNTLRELYSENTSLCKIINLHGELHNNENPIIFGYSADDDENYNLLSKNNRDYLINIKAYNYKKTNFEKNLNDYYQNTENSNSDIFILGHSCSLSDRNILNKIFNVKNLVKLNILYYEKFEFYRDTLINIHRVMDSNDNYQQIINFDDSMMSPQITDTQVEVEAFERKLKKYFS